MDVQLYRVRFVCHRARVGKARDRMGRREKWSMVWGVGTGFKTLIVEWNALCGMAVQW